MTRKTVLGLALVLVISSLVVLFSRGPADVGVALALVAVFLIAVHDLIIGDR